MKYFVISAFCGALIAVAACTAPPPHPESEAEIANRTEAASLENERLLNAWLPAQVIGPEPHVVRPEIERHNQAIWQRLQNNRDGRAACPYTVNDGSFLLRTREGRLMLIVSGRRPGRGGGFGDVRIQPNANDETTFKLERYDNAHTVNIAQVIFPCDDGYADARMAYEFPDIAERIVARREANAIYEQELAEYWRRRTERGN